MIEQSIVDKIIDRCDIVDIITEYVPSLKQKGTGYQACCPFHSEKTPSFHVSPAKGIWHCFGCNKGGNAVIFLQEYLHISFPEALHTLAKKYGIQIEEREPTAKEKQEQAKREAMLIINEKCQKHFRNNILKPANKDAFDYAVARWGEEYAEEVGIGFATDSWDDTLNFAKENALSLSIMAEMGLIKEREKGGYYDFYRNRITIPVRDKYGRVIAFSARDLSGVEGTAKYLNSPESEIYHKNKSVFGLDTAIRQAVKEDKFYAVEGGPDVLQMQRIRIFNTIAPLGGDWTDNKFEQLKKYATRICFVPDADPPKLDRGEKIGAGHRNAMRNGVLAMKAGFSVTIREIPLGDDNTKNDPDNFSCSTKKTLSPGMPDTHFKKFLIPKKPTKQSAS